MIKQRMKYASARGFALDKDMMRTIMARIAADGRDGYKTVTGLPSGDTIRAWRARNRDVTYRHAENKRVA